MSRRVEWARLQAGTEHLQWNHCSGLRVALSALDLLTGACRKHRGGGMSLGTDPGLAVSHPQSAWCFCFVQGLARKGT